MSTSTSYSYIQAYFPCFKLFFLLTEGEKRKSAERWVINSFTVIKTLKSLKGVRLLMRCDILESLRTQNCTVTMHYVRERKCSQLGKERKKKKKINKRRVEVRGRWDAFITLEG